MKIKTNKRSTLIILSLLLILIVINSIALLNEYWFIPDSNLIINFLEYCGIMISFYFTIQISLFIKNIIED